MSTKPRSKTPLVVVSTEGKSKEQIVAEAVRLLRKAKLLKETPRSRKIK